MNTKVYERSETIHLSDSIYRAIVICYGSRQLEKMDRVFLGRLFADDVLLHKNDLIKLIMLVHLVDSSPSLIKAFDDDSKEILAMVGNRPGILRLEFFDDVTIVTFYSTVRKGKQPSRDYISVTYSCSGHIQHVAYGPGTV